MADHQNEPAWIPFVGVAICIITFTAIFIELRNVSNFSLIPSIAITVFAGSIIATLLNGIAQAIINAILGINQESQSIPEPQLQAQKKPKTED